MNIGTFVLGLKMDNSWEDSTKAIPMEMINLGPVKWIYTI